MVADIRLLQGKVIEDPSKRVQNISRLIEALSQEFVQLEQSPEIPQETPVVSAQAPAETSTPEVNS